MKIMLPGYRLIFTVFIGIVSSSLLNLNYKKLTVILEVKFQFSVNKLKFNYYYQLSNKHSTIVLCNYPQLASGIKLRE